MKVKQKLKQPLSYVIWGHILFPNRLSFNNASTIVLFFFLPICCTSKRTHKYKEGKKIVYKLHSCDLTSLNCSLLIIYF